MRTGPSYHRLIGFVDAVVAIAMTLLVLPLVEIPGEIADNSDESVWDLLDEHSGQLLSFAISFLVVWSLWRAHHRLMDDFRGYDRTVLFWHLVWLVTVVLLAFTTQLLNAGDFYHRGAPVVYLANLLVSALSISMIGVHGHRHPELQVDKAERTHEDFDAAAAWSTTVVVAVALVAVLIWPVVGMWPLVLLVVDDPVRAAARRWNRRRAAARTRGRVSR